MKASVFILRILNVFILIASIGTSTLSIADSRSTNDSISQKLSLLDDAFQQLMEDTISGHADDMASYQNIDKLLTLFAESNQYPHKTYLTIMRNLNLLEADASHDSISKLVELLLEENQRWLAEIVYARIEAQNDDATLAALDFQFAKYFRKLGEWQSVKQLTRENYNYLSNHEADFAHLLQGTANQHLKNHRESIDSYANISRVSPYFLYAQLNTALANIRQGWLSDARLIFNQILQSKTDEASDLLNRTRLVFAYALLQKEYYRDAREKFRKIEIDSQYFTRAMMGLSLTAISQGDFVGGLKTIKLLKQNGGNDLSSDEAYLVLPYIYQKLEQPLEIVRSFEEAIDHYQNRLLELNLIKKQSIDVNNLAPNTEGKILLNDFSFNIPNESLILRVKEPTNTHFTNQ